MKHAMAFVLFFALICFTMPAQAALIYSNDFSSGSVAGWSTTSTAYPLSTRTSNGETYLASSNTTYGFGNQTVSLTLTGLSVGSSATIDFDLYVIGSWDGNGNYATANPTEAWCQPDNWEVKVNGQQEIYTNIAHYTVNGQTQAYPSSFGSGASNPARTGATATNHLGYGTGYYGDSTYHFSILADDITSSTLTIAFTSYQSEGVYNEGWGLDNVKVSTSSVPVPPSVLLLAPGLIGLVTIRRRLQG